MNAFLTASWRRHGAIALVVVATALACALFYPTLLTLIEAWNGKGARPTYTHGYLIVATAGWLLFLRREKLASIAWKPEPLAVPVLLGLSLVWLVFERAALQLGGQAVFPLFILFAVLAVGGREIARVTALPILYLYFAVPAWDVLLQPLRDITTAVNVTMAAVVGIPALMEGNVVHIPAGSFEIADGCSGLHYLITALALATFAGEMYLAPLKNRLLLAALATFAALLTNWVRVFAIIAAGHLTDMQHFLVTTDHYWFGWGLFVGAGAIVVWVGARWLRETVTEPVPAVATAPLARASAVMCVAVVAAMVVGPLMGYLSSRAAPGGLVLDPPAIDGWQYAGAYQGAWRPTYEHADAELRLRYVGKESDTGLVAYAALYLNQQQGQEITGFRNSIFGEESVHVTRRPRAIDGSRLDAQFRDDRADEYVLQWNYIVGDRSFSSTLRSQLWYGLSSLWSRPRAWVVAVAAPCSSNDACESARDAASGLLTQLTPALTRGNASQQRGNR